MPTNDHLSLTAALAWLRVQVGRLRRAVMARRPVVRWGAAVVALIGLTSMVYWAATSLSTLSVRYLVSGRRFSSEDLITVCRTLDKQQVAYEVDDLRRVTVSTDQYAQAADAVAKLDLGPRSLNELREESILSSFLDTSSDREHRHQLYREKTIERQIGELPGVVWSFVSVKRPQTRKFQHPTAKPTAFVYIETEGKRRLPSVTVQSIPAILAGLEDELTPGSITVMDTRGNRYLESGNLAVGLDSHDRAREEELLGEIVEKLGIKGVRVHVKVPSSHALEPTSAAAGAANTGKTGGGALTSQSGGSIASIIVNRPADSLDPELLPRLPGEKNTAMTSAADSNPAGGGNPRDHERQPKSEPGQVLILVPRSYYLNADVRADNREPSKDDLQTLKQRTEEQIRKAVGLITPASESWKIDVDMFIDEGSLNRPLAIRSPVDARRKALDWGIVGTVVAVVSILAAAGSWIKVARRPVVIAESAVTTRRYHVDSASEPGPSERVRELVRRNPEAAASVLQRWTGQGGHG
jgi:flagellar M-ring protein FliF